MLVTANKRFCPIRNTFNSLLRTANLSDVKPLMVGHRGTVPGQNFIYVHLNRLRGIHKNRKDIQFESRCRTAQGV